MRVLLADSQPKVRFALRALLERQPGLTVVGEAADAESLLTQVEATRPNMVLVDWDLPGRSTPGLFLALRQAGACQWVIALSGRPESRRPALAAGVDAFVSKGDPPERLLEAIYNLGWQRERQDRHPDRT